MQRLLRMDAHLRVTVPMKLQQDEQAASLSEFLPLLGMNHHLGEQGRDVTATAERCLARRANEGSDTVEAADHLACLRVILRDKLERAYRQLGGFGILVNRKPAAGRPCT